MLKSFSGADNSRVKLLSQSEMLPKISSLEYGKPSDPKETTTTTAAATSISFAHQTAFKVLIVSDL